MKTRVACWSLLAIIASAIPIDATFADGRGSPSDDDLTTENPAGKLRTYTPGGTIDHSNPFFQSLGSNGRSCGTCHVQRAAWATSARGVRERFRASQGTDPIFRPVDGANSPLADVSTLEARRKAYSMLLQYGVIRVGIPIHESAEFRLTGVADPYGYASASELSLFRRPLPAANLRFLTGVMWDGRESAGPFVPPMDAGRQHEILVGSLLSQANNATLGHAQAQNPPSMEQLSQIVEFELSLTTAQIRDRRAGRLDAGGALGGPRALANQHFYIGINDPLGLNPTGEPFSATAAMNLFDAWSERGGHRYRPARAAIQRGEEVFNTLPITISGVAGLNDAPGMEVVQGHCSTCHDAPNVGNHSLSAPLDIGTSDATRIAPGFPLYALTNIATGETVQTTDPGLAMITGEWEDIGKFKGPVLRGLAARAPYFHNGAAETLGDVIDFYNERFGIGITRQQKEDLVAFLAAL